MTDEIERIAVVETKVDNLQKSLDNMPSQIVTLMEDKMTIKILECSKSRDSRFAGIKTAHLTAGGIAGSIVGIFKFAEWMWGGKK